MINKTMKMFKLLALTLVTALLINISLPVLADDGDLPSVRSATEYDFITDVILRDQNGAIIESGDLQPLDADQSITLEFAYAIPNELNVVEGDFTKIKLPNNFTLFSEISGSLIFGGESIGTYTLGMDRELILVFNEFAESHSEVQGKVEINSSFDVSKITETYPVKVVFKFSDTAEKTYTLKFSPTDTSKPVVKNGRLLDADTIEWSIDINKNLLPLTDLTITDTMGSGLGIPTNFKVYHLSVAMNGDTTLGDLVNPVAYTVSGESSTGFGLLMHGDIDTAYRIVYETDIVNKAVDEYVNTATIDKDNSSQAKVTIVKGDTIDKFGVANKPYNSSSIDWTIDINKDYNLVTTPVVNDVIPAGLTYDASSLTIYKVIELNSNGTVKTREALPLVYGTDYIVDESVVVGGTSLTVTFTKPIADPYQIEYTTTIVDKSKLTFKNQATINGKSDFAEVTTKRGTLIAKSGTPKIGYNDQKYMEWTIDVNTDEEIRTGVIITDIIGDNQELQMDSFEIYNLSINDKGTASITGTKLAGFTPIPTASPYGFTLDLKNINTAYRVIYRTKILNFATKVTNTASIGGVGTGEKSPNTNLDHEFGKTGTGINYSDNTMGWKITVNPRKEAIEGLKIVDTLSAGLTMEGLPVVKAGSTVLILNTDYSYALTGGDPTKGFTITFLKTVNDAVYTIAYRTKFNPFHSSETVGQTKFDNTAVFYIDTTKITDKYAKQEVEEIAYKNGSKSGVLDRTTKTITWTVNLNYLSRSLTEISLSDIIQPGQLLKTDTIKVYAYNVAANGNIINKTLIANDLSVYDTTGTTANLLKVRFLGPITTPYMVEFKTDIVGITKGKYENQAIANGITYDASVNYTESDKFVTKEGAQKGSILEWTVKVNTSQSEIDKATLVDTMSDGQELNMNSFVVKNNATNAVLIKDTDYTVVLGERELATGIQQFTLSFKNSIDVEHTVTYSTLITTEVTNTPITNTIDFEGEGNKVITQTTEKKVIVQISKGSGTGFGVVGSIKILKTDGTSNLPLQGVEFELFNASNKSMGKGKTDATGMLLIPRLKYGTYTLKEITPLPGYAPRPDQVVVINATNLNPTIELKNLQLGIITINKIDGRDSTHATKIANVEFALYDSTKTIVLQTKSTDASGSIAFDKVPVGIYFIKETAAPEGFIALSEFIGVELKEEGGVVAIVKDVVNQIIKNDIKITKVNTSGVALRGATFKLYKKGDLVKVLDEAVSDEFGVVTFADIEYGDYVVVETKAPSGYRVDSTPKEVEVRVNKDVDVLPYELEFINTRIPTTNVGGKILVNKVDSEDSSKGLAGATFGIYNSAGVRVAVLVTNSLGKASYDELPVGVYTVREITAPEGYELSTEITTVNINRLGASAELTFKNTKKPVEPTKPVDPTKPTKPTNPDETEDLEEEVPTGGVDPLPNTGDNGNAMYYVLGLLLIGLGVGLKKKKVRE